MCLAVPAKILEIDGDVALVDYGGVRRETRLDLVDANIGDYVLIHAGFAIETMDKNTAMTTLKELKDIALAGEKPSETK